MTDKEIRLLELEQEYIKTKGKIDFVEKLNLETHSLPLDTNQELIDDLRSRLISRSNFLQYRLDEILKEYYQLEMDIVIN